MTQPTPTANQEQERILIWQDIRHLYKTCDCEGSCDSQDRNADPAWRELQRLIHIAASRNWIITDPYIDVRNQNDDFLPSQTARLDDTHANT
jgi:hypothetical protein